MEWISVKDRLPEKDCKYLCYRHGYAGDNGYCDVLRYGTIYNDNDEGEERGFYFFDFEYGTVKVGDVTHWMGLPEPPKENEK